MENTKGSEVDTDLKFIDLINQHSADKLAELMTEDHVFIDSLGQSVSGREQMRLGWKGYFAFCPDYWVSHEEMLSGGNLVAVFGAAGGTIAADGKLPPENKWRTSAAWLAIVDGGLVKQTGVRHHRQIKAKSTTVESAPAFAAFYSIVGAFECCHSPGADGPQ
jgi:ketosteroid isomerase-like protein